MTHGNIGLEVADLALVFVLLVILLVISLLVMFGRGATSRSYQSATELALLRVLQPRGRGSV